MIRGIGIDTIEIERFKNWHTYPKQKLLRIFSAQEIVYCRSNPAKTAERFAVRFAAREAFFKAYNHVVNNATVPFLTVCKNIQILHQKNGAPQMHAAWQNLLPSTTNHHQFKTHISLAHSQATATAFVIIER